MPEFYPEHTPSGLDEFTQGYLNAAEWLLDEEIDRSEVHGWSNDAILHAKGECEQFQRENAAELARYYEVTGRDESDAGHDFWLTRNRHGAGFWGRESDPVNDPCLDALTEQSHAYGEIDTYLYRGLIRFV